MASFQIGISPRKRASARFIGAVRRGLQMMLAEENLTQSDLARELGVHRSVISREIRGDKDITLGRIGELAYLLGRRAEISFPKRKALDGANHAPRVERFDVAPTSEGEKPRVEKFDLKAA